MRFLTACAFAIVIPTVYGALLDAIDYVDSRAALDRRSDSVCALEYFTQPIDHFGQHNGTFQQKYNLVTDLFKPGEPILFFQGEESTTLDCVVSSSSPSFGVLKADCAGKDTTIYYSWAQELGGIAVSLEHRYFGAPFGAKDPPTQPEEFKYLTLDNVVADAANFVETLKKDITVAESSKAIVASGESNNCLVSFLKRQCR